MNIESLPVKIGNNKVCIGDYTFNLNQDVTVLDKDGNVVLKGKVVFTIYIDGEGYIDFHHLGVVVKVLEAYNNRIGSRITLPDLLCEIYNNNWKLKGDKCGKFQEF